MHRPGHYGVALLAYAPVGLLTLALGFNTVAVAGGVIVVGGAMLPDLDMRVPFITHRGPTHTVWFALVVGIVLGVAGALIGSDAGVAAALGLGVFGTVVGVLTVGAHLLADALTPMGVQPLAPVRDVEYTLSVATASNLIANYALLALGILAAALAFVLGSAVTNAVSL